MKQYEVVISSKGQFVLPKEIREQFKLSAGSKIRVVVDGEQIILTPRTVADELEEFILTDIARDGKTVNKETIKEYKLALNKTLDKLVAEADEEYKKKEYVSLAELKQDKGNV